MGELIELAESLRAVLEDNTRRRAMVHNYKVAYVMVGSESLEKRHFATLEEARKFGQGVMNAGGVENLWLIELPSGKTLTLWPDY